MDCGKYTCRTEKGLVWQICKASENLKYLKAMIIHCIIHQQVFCEKYWNYVIEPVVSPVKFTCPQKLNYD